MAKQGSSSASKRRDPGKHARRGISDREVDDVEEMSMPRTPVIYEVVRRLGEEEMTRPATSLWWSGLAAGLSISFSAGAGHPADPSAGRSLASPGCGPRLLRRLRWWYSETSNCLPRAPSRSYFLPQTRSTWTDLWRVGRLWAIVLAANLRGHVARRAVLHLHAGAGRTAARHGRGQPASDQRWAGCRCCLPASVPDF